MKHIYHGFEAYFVFTLSHSIPPSLTGLDDGLGQPLPYQRQGVTTSVAASGSRSWWTYICSPEGPVLLVFLIYNAFLWRGLPHKIFFCLCHCSRYICGGHRMASLYFFLVCSICSTFFSLFLFCYFCLFVVLSFVCSTININSTFYNHDRIPLGPIR